MPRTGRLADALAAGPPLVLDAAMGTRLFACGLDFDRDDPALWNLSRPDDVLDLHRRDVRAGADVVLANTFGASRPWLARFGRAEEVGAINAQAVALARAAAGPGRFVLGSIGPGAAIGDGSAYAEQALLLIAEGVDGLILETHRIDQAETGLRRISSLATVPILVSLHEWPEPEGPAARRLIALGASALGANCGTGPEGVIRATEAMARIVEVPWIAKPSAGTPGGEIATPAEFGAIAQRFRDLGVRLIGGCCGTTEAHVAAIRAVFEDP